VMCPHSRYTPLEFFLNLSHIIHINTCMNDKFNVQVEYGPSPDLKFGCTLTLDLQVRILEVIDFDEKKGPPSPFKLGAIMGATSPNAAGEIFKRFSQKSVTSNLLFDCDTNLANSEFLQAHEWVLAPSTLEELSMSRVPLVRRLSLSCRMVSFLYYVLFFISFSIFAFI